MANSARPSLRFGRATRRGQVPLSNKLDGSSNTFLLGEKHISPDAFFQKLNYGDGCVYDHYYGRYHTRVAGPANSLLAQFDNCHGDPTQCFRGFSSWHAGICQFAFADGHVQAVNNGTDPYVLYLLAVRDDGYSIPPF